MLVHKDLMAHLIHTEVPLQQVHYGTQCINFIPTIAPQIHHIYAQIALGKKQ